MKTLRLHNHRPAGAGPRRGFTLVETSMVMVIIGVACLAMLELLAAGSVSNSDGTGMTTGINLASNVREIAMGLKFRDPEFPDVWATKESTVKDYDDIKDLDGETFSPPRDVKRDQISGYAGWAQVIKVETVALDQVSSARPKNPADPVVRVTVTIRHQGKEIYQTSWLAADPAPPKPAPL